MRIGDLATILTVGGVSIYVLGLIGLAIPIRREFTGDISTAWYAVSLVPKTVVAGQGVRIWMRWTVVFAVLQLVMIGGLRLLALLIPFDPQFLLSFGTQVVAFISLLVFVRHTRKSRAVVPRLLVDFGSPRKLATSFATFVLPLYVGALLTFISFSIIAVPEDNLFEWVQIISTPGGNPSVFRGIVILLIGSFFLGLPFAISASAPLPQVRITKQPEDSIEGVADPLEGWLVAHTDGFWHLFPRFPYEDEEHRVQEHRDLISIPDDKAVVVRTFGKEDALTEAAPETDGQRDTEEARLETERDGEV